MSDFNCLQWSESDGCSLAGLGRLTAASSCCEHLETGSSETLSISTFVESSQLAVSSVITVARRLRFLLRHVGLLDRTSFQIWSRWLIGWSGSRESTDLWVTKQWNTLLESRSRVTAFSRSISCRDSCFAPANVVGSESCRVLSAIFCSITFNSSLFNFKSELHELYAAYRHKWTTLANDSELSKPWINEWNCLL